MIEVALAVYLDAQGLVTYEPAGASGDCFIDALPSSPEAAVMIKATGGPALVDGAWNPWDEPTVQVLVRGSEDPRSGKQVAQAIFDALQGLHNTTLDEGGADAVYLVSATAIQSAPAHIGRDDNGRHLFSQNHALHVRADTPNRT